MTNMNVNAKSLTHCVCNVQVDKSFLEFSWTFLESTCWLLIQILI